MNFECTPKKPSPHPSLFYGWIIVIIGFITLSIAFGVWYSYSVFILAVIKEFSWSRAEASSIFSVFLLSHSIMNPLTGLLQDHFGPRFVIPLGTGVLGISMILTGMANTLWHYTITYGIFAGAGISLLGFSSHAAFLPRWFERKRGLAVGLTMSGIGFGMLFLVPLIAKSISVSGWRTTYFYMAGVVVFLTGPLNIVFARRSPESMGLKPYGARDIGSSPYQKSSMAIEIIDAAWVKKTWTFKTALATKRFWLLAFAFFFMAFGYQGTLLHCVSAMVDKGLTREAATYYFGILGATGLVGKILFGYLSDLYGRECVTITGSVMASIGLLCLIHVHSSSGCFLFLFAILFGLGYSVLASLLPTIIADIFLGKAFGVIFAAISIGGGFGGATGAYLAGFLFDLTHTYTIPFIIFILGISSSAGLIWLAAPRQIRRMLKTNQHLI